VKSKNQYNLYATVNGLIRKIYVAEGDRVKKGDPIINVINEASKLNVENAQLAADYAEVTANEDKLKEMKIAIDLARTKVTNDSLLYARQQNLWERQVGTRVDLEQRELAYRNSVTAWQTALLRYNDLKRQIDFTARQSRKNLQLSSSLAREFTILSLIDGKVYTIYKEPGEMVNPQSPIAVVGDSTVFLLELQVDEYDIARIIEGQRVIVAMDSYKGEVFEARVDRISPLMNSQSKSFTIEATFVTQPPRLYPNLTAEANIIIQTRDKTLTIPRNYLVGDSLVMLRDGKMKKVKIGLRDYQKAEVLEGLSETDVLLKPLR
jgi:multidrug efflux pump subunit AcrA (membrane-fusion protein)